MKGEGTRQRLNCRERGYHGVGFGGISVGGIGTNRNFFGSLLAGVDRLPHTHSLEHNAFSILLIFDEVITGFGRVGSSFATEYFGVVPDIVTAAKGITNGTVPMGGCL